MRAFTFFLICLFVSGCKVGPDYHPPEVSIPEAYIESVPEKTAEIDDENLIEWWTLFHDPFLDYLIETALMQNFDYQIALEQVYQARAIYWTQFTQILPEFNATATGSRFRTSQSFRTASSTASGISPYQSFFQLGLDAVWEIDLFGKLRRNAEASRDLWEATVEEMRGVKIVVISEVASTYTSICAFQKKKKIAEEAVQQDIALLQLAKNRFEAGLGNRQGVEQAQGVLEADRAQLFLIDFALKNAIYSMSVLLGKLPEAVMADFDEERPIPIAEGRIPVGLPSELLRRRPDIASAERQLASATEQIGVAVAALFPSLSLTGSSSSFAANPLQGANVGFTSDRINKLLRSQSLIWGVGGFVNAPVFDFGNRLAAVDAQTAFRNQAYYAYEKAVVNAFQETEQALAAYFSEEKREISLAREVAANEKVLQLTQDLFQAGLVSQTEVLNAKDVYLLSLNGWTDSKQALTTDLIAIYKALGGDW